MRKLGCVVYKIRADGYYASDRFEKTLYHPFQACVIRDLAFRIETFHWNAETSYLQSEIDSRYLN